MWKFERLYIKKNENKVIKNWVSHERLWLYLTAPPKLPYKTASKIIIRVPMHIHIYFHDCQTPIYDKIVIFIDNLKIRVLKMRFKYLVKLMNFWKMFSRKICFGRWFGPALYNYLNPPRISTPRPSWGVNGVFNIYC